MTQEVAPDQVGRFIKTLHENDERPVEKVLVRAVTEDVYACQVWHTGEKEPEGFYVYLTD